MYYYDISYEVHWLPMIVQWNISSVSWHQGNKQRSVAFFCIPFSFGTWKYDIKLKGESDSGSLRMQNTRLLPSRNQYSVPPKRHNVIRFIGRNGLPYSHGSLMTKVLGQIGMGHKLYNKSVSPSDAMSAVMQRVACAARTHGIKEFPQWQIYILLV